MQTVSKVSISVTVNGKRSEHLVSPTFTLLEVLRDELGLTGAKRGREDGTCGTCTVIVNGAMARACRVPLDRADGNEVLTIEGMGSADKLHPLQEAFIEVDAVQCGFRTPGMIMASKALLDRNDSPDRGQMAQSSRQQPVSLHRLCQRAGRRPTRQRSE